MTTAPIHDHANYDYETADTAGGEFTYHRVTKETAGKVNVVGGTQNVGEGDVLVPTERGDVFTVLPGSAVDELLAGKGSQSDADATSGSTPAPTKARNRSVDRNVVESDDFGDPADRTAAEVNRRISYLRREGRNEEAESLADAERNGKNRRSAIPAE